MTVDERLIPKGDSVTHQLPDFLMGQTWCPIELNAIALRVWRQENVLAGRI